MLYPSKNLCYPVLDPNLSRGQVGYWPLDDQGGIAYDRSGYGNHGPLVGNTHSVVSERGRCLSFDGAGDYVDAGNNPSINITNNQITVSIWVYAAATSSYLIIVDKGEAWTKGYYLYRRDNDNWITWRVETTGGDNYVQTSRAIPNVWQHIVGTYNGSIVRIYVDGITVGGAEAVAASGNINATTNNLWIGQSRVAGINAFNGLISDATIHNRALSAQEIQQLYLYGIHIHRDLIELWTTSGTIIPRIQYYNQQARA